MWVLACSRSALLSPFHPIAKTTLFTVIHQLVLTQCLQLHELIVIASFCQKLIVCSRLAHFALLDEVAVYRMRHEQCLFKNPGNGMDTTYIQHFEWLTNNAQWQSSSCPSLLGPERPAQLSRSSNPVQMSPGVKIQHDKIAYLWYAVHVPHPTAAPWGSATKHGRWQYILDHTHQPDVITDD